jgi:hypothetical protein
MKMVFNILEEHNGYIYSVAVMRMDAGAKMKNYVENRSCYL